MFFEEARELLIGLEEGLMDLERRQGDRAHLDRTFRAAHSLKGAAAMVGLAKLAEFTHGIEAVLDRVRSGSLAVDSDVITTLLESRDHLVAMVEAEAAQSPILASNELTQRLSDLLRGSGSGGGPAARGPASPPPAPTGPPPSSPASPPATPGPPPAKAAPAPPPAAATIGEGRPPGSEPLPPAGTGSRDGAKVEGSQAQKKSRAPRKKANKPGLPPDAGRPAPGPVAKKPARPGNVYRVTLAPGPDTLRRGINPLGVFDELRELGATRIEPNPEAVPDLDEIDPERCYLAWTITVETGAGVAQLNEVFLFFTEDSTISIERGTDDGGWLPIGEPETPAPPAAPAWSDADRAGRATPIIAREKEPARPEPIAPPPTPTPPAPAPPVPAPAAAPRPAAVAAAPTHAVARPNARIRVDATQLDDLVGLAGELAVLSDNLIGLREVDGTERWLHALESLQRVSREIRDTTLDLRMVPVDELFSRVPRIVRDLADRCGKRIELRIVGQETKLDRTIVERLNEPMLHLIRNAVDHALETPAEREAAGKPPAGRITLSAGHEGDRVAVRVEDDGRGLDREKIVKKGIALGMIAPGTAADDPRVVSLIFEPGFSTRDSVSEISGRGVGLDVVRDAVRALRGTVAVESYPSKGTAFIFRLPLTLALIDGLLVETAGGKYVVPLAQVEECVALNGTRSALADDRPCIAVRGELVPMVSLRHLFHADGPLPSRQELLLTRHAGQRVGIAVDRLLGRVQAVIQSLGEGLHGVNRFSGATILGDGSVSLILDLSALVSESRFAEQSARFTPSAFGRAESFR
jgi:two-component system, chemotaxis family, sensor kinase CheA